MAEIRHNQGEAGGYLVGNRHSEGGIKAVNKSTGQPLEMEGGEVVITRDAVSDPKKRSFNGKMMTNRQILSEINQSGGGVAFADGGDVPESMHFDADAEYEYGGDTMCGCDLATRMSSRESFDDGGSVSVIPIDAPSKAQELPDLGAGYFQWKKREFLISDHEFAVGKIEYSGGFKRVNPIRNIGSLMDAFGVVFGLLRMKANNDPDYYTLDPEVFSNYFNAGINTRIVFGDMGEDGGSYNEGISLWFGPYNVAEGSAKIPSGATPTASAFFGDLEADLEKNPSFYDAYLWLRDKLTNLDHWIQINPPLVQTEPKGNIEEEFLIDADLKTTLILDFLAYLDKSIVPYITMLKSIYLFEENGRLLSPSDLWDSDKNDWFISSEKTLSRNLQVFEAYSDMLNEGNPLNMGTAKKFDSALKKMLKERPELEGQKITLLISGQGNGVLLNDFAWSALSQFTITKKSNWESLKDIIISDARLGHLPRLDHTNFLGRVSFDTMSSRFIECDDSTAWKGGYVLQTLRKTTDKVREIVNRGYNYGPPMRSVLFEDWKGWAMEKLPKETLDAFEQTFQYSKSKLDYRWNNTSGSKQFFSENNPVAKGFELIFRNGGLFKQGARSNYMIDGKGLVVIYPNSLYYARKQSLDRSNWIRTNNRDVFDKYGVFARSGDNFDAQFVNHGSGNAYLFGENIEDIFMLAKGAEIKRKEALAKQEEAAKKEAEKKRKAEERARAKAEAEEKRKEEIRNRPYQINDQPEDLAKFSLDFAMPEAQPLLKDLEALKKLLNLAHGLKNAPMKRAILLKIRRLTEKRNNLSIQENSTDQKLDSKKLMTPMGLMVYYYNQARQSPVSKMGEPCGLETPTGVPSKLDIQAYHAVRTSYFKAWFGDWEQAAETGNYADCSLLVDEETKEPRIMYHGVRRFDPRIQTGAMGSGVRRPFGEFNPPKFPATYFGDSLDYVEFYAGQAENQPKIDPNYEGFIYSVFINMRNPIRLDGLGLYSSYKDLLAYVAFKYGILVEPSKDLLQQMQSAKKRLKVWNYVRNDFNLIIALKKAGYDGIIQYGDVPSFSPEGKVSGMKEAKEYLVFNANQVKSALVKKSFYLPQFNDIRFKDGGHVRL